ncbi:MAG: alpha/beta hydrolase [Holophagales bacterium]|nr:alpha/beta hydrolase [Holophagales bacterium]MYG30211.1 alpha/beta hydrolase [Holophagales bacterium]MYI81047.1 alpha/beta hydrolase [Holophagales bacterium]
MMIHTKKPRSMFAAVLAALVLTVAFAGAHAQGEASTRSFTASDGVEIHYVVEGRGDPVVLLHGITGTAASNWGAAGIIGRLAEEFQVIAVDQRGHGMSGKPHDPASYGERMALDVVDLLDHLRLQQAHVVGYSMGGFITMKLVALAPDRLMSAVVGGAGWPSPELRDDAMFDALAASLEAGKGGGPLVEFLWPGEEPPTPEQVQAIGQAMVAANDQMALAAVVRGMPALDVNAELLRINKVPTLNIIGSDDPLKPNADALVDVMKEHRLHVIEGANHMTTLSSPEFLDTVRAFFIELCNCA